MFVYKGYILLLCTVVSHTLAEWRDYCFRSKAYLQTCENFCDAQSKNYSFPTIA